jgi:hypothetical protein
VRTPDLAGRSRQDNVWFALGQFGPWAIDAGDRCWHAPWAGYDGWRATMPNDAEHPIPDDVRDGDVLVYMNGRLLVVDHLVPEAYAIDLVELENLERGATDSSS